MLATLHGESLHPTTADVLNIYIFLLTTYLSAYAFPSTVKEINVFFCFLKDNMGRLGNVEREEGEREGGALRKKQYMATYCFENI